MWKNLSLKNVSKIERCVGEYNIWMVGILPYGKMKVKIYEDNSGTFSGYTDINVKLRSDDNYPESAVGFGKTQQEALSETIKNFNELLEREYPEEQFPEGLSGDYIEYTEPSDF